jgi:hypothetical protein
MSGRDLLVGLALIVALCNAPPVMLAQTPETTPEAIRGRIVLIAGADLHLELASPVPLEPGDMLLVPRGDAGPGRLIVIAADSLRAVVTFVDERFALTRGQWLDAAVLRPPRPPDSSSAPAVAEPDAATTVGGAVLAAGAAADSLSPGAPGPAAATAGSPVVPAAGVNSEVAASARAGGTGPRAFGYVATEVDWVRYEAMVDRRNDTRPTATLYLLATQLPGGASATVYARAEHQNTIAGPLAGARDGATRLHVHTARLGAAAGPLRLSLGRLGSMVDPFGGAWDGVAVEVGRDLSAGLEAGWQPDRGTGSPSLRHPRVGFSTQAVAATRTLRYRGNAAVLRYLAEVPAGAGRVALSTSHSLSAGPLGFWGDVAAETAGDGSFDLRWAGVRLQLQARGRGRIYGGIRRHRPYVWDVLDSLAATPTRTRIEGGGLLPLGRASLAVNAATSPGSSRSMSATATLLVPELPGGFDVELSGGNWRYGSARTAFASGGLARRTGRIDVRVLYRIELGPARDGDRDFVHEIAVDGTVALNHRATIGGTIAQSAAPGADGARAHLRLTWGF